MVAIADLLLGACMNQEPVQIGFIGALTDRDSDQGQSGRPRRKVFCAQIRSGRCVKLKDQ